MEYAAEYIWLTMCWICGFIFNTMGYWASKRKTPMHFWSGSTVKGEDISDIPAYNRENAVMWHMYSIVFWVAGVLYNFIGISLVFLSAFPGVIILILNYNRIERKYNKNKKKD